MSRLKAKGFMPVGFQRSIKSNSKNLGEGGRLNHEHQHIAAGKRFW